MFDVTNLAEINLAVIRPQLVLSGFALLVMLIDMFTSDEKSEWRNTLSWVALLGVLVTGYVTVGLWTQSPLSFQGAAVLDHFAIGVNLVVLTATGLSILLSAEYMPRINKQVGEYYALLLFCAVGMMSMGSATDLITVFLALEIFSLALYIMSGLNRKHPRSTEAAMKYFLLGAFASAFFAYGAALIYGAVGSTQFNAIADALTGGAYEPLLFLPGMGLLIVGFGFKIGMVPFHMWTPDVYQGAPTPITAFMSVGTKAAAFAAFVRVLTLVPEEHKITIGWILAFFAVLTMTLGNLAALRQTSLKRMLAYSSIAHAGYILVGLVPGTESSAHAAIFYLFIYAFMNIGAFAVAIALENGHDYDTLQTRATGISRRWPLLAFAMAILMFGLSGLPPMAGFLGKFLIFKAAVEEGWVILAIIAMLNSAASAYYYIRVIVAMYFDKPNDKTAPERRNWLALNIGLGLSAALTLLIGIIPSLWSGWFLIQ